MDLAVDGTESVAGACAAGLTGLAVQKRSDLVSAVGYYLAVVYGGCSGEDYALDGGMD
jgi:hypothetical protein